MQVKVCKKCGQSKELSEFGLYKRTRDGLNNDCKECRREGANQWSRNHQNRRRRSYEAYYSSPRGFFTRLRLAAKHRGTEFLLNFEDFVEWFESQESNCLYCGRQLTRGNGYRADNTTVDRLDNDAGYALGNIVLSCRRCNSIKGNTFNKQEMIEIADKYIKPKLLRGEL